MNYSTAVFLINDDVRAVACTYEEGDRATRTIFKTMDKTIKPDDFVIVPTDTRHKMTVVKVAAIVEDVDLDSSTQMAWIIGKVERHDFEALLEMEREAIETIKAAEIRKKKKAMRDAIFEHHEAMLDGLQLVKLEAPASSKPAIEPALDPL